MAEQWISELTRRALTWGAWAAVVATLVGSVPPADAHVPLDRPSQQAIR